MKFFLLCLLWYWPLWAADSTDCEPADTVTGDAFYFSIKNASFYGDAGDNSNGSTHILVRVPVRYDSSFWSKEKQIEAKVILKNGQNINFYVNTFLVSKVNGGCGGITLEFNLLKFQMRDSPGQKPSPGYTIRESDLIAFRNSQSSWEIRSKN